MGAKQYKLSDRITEIRELAKLSQSELARRMEVSPSLISHWESGTRTPSQVQILALARHLGVALDYLLYAEVRPTFHCQFRAQSARDKSQKTAVHRALVDASMQIFFVDSVLRLAEKPAEAFSLKADFSFPHVNRLADSFRETLRVNRRVTLAELKQALAEWNIFVFDWALPYRISGMSFRGALTAIFINSLHDRTRRLFTLAHEFAHILFHLGRDQEHSTIVSMIASNQDPHEKEANAFASEFLMPSQDIDAVVRTHGDRLKDPVLLEAVARTFHVSRDAVFYRLAHHGVFRWEEKSKYFTKHTEPEPPQTRVTDIEEQVAGPFLETALSLYLQERASAGKLAEWFFAPRHVVEEYLSGLSRDQDNALASEPEHVPAGHHDGDANL